MLTKLVLIFQNLKKRIGKFQKNFPLCFVILNINSETPSPEVDHLFPSALPYPPQWER